MCTAIAMDDLFGRTLDVEGSYGEYITAAPRNFRFDFLREGASLSHLAMVGIAALRSGVPLFYDALNETGLYMAALKFPVSTVYGEPTQGMHNVASFELIPWVLGQCEGVCAARRLLGKTNVTGDSFSSELGATPLHFFVADKTGAIVVESVTGGLKIYDDPLGVLTNEPPFEYHMARVCDFFHLDSRHTKNTLCDCTLSPYSNGLGAVGLPGDFSSSSRFVRAVFAKNHTDGARSDAERVSRFFRVADTVSVPRGCEKNADGESVFTRYTSCADAAGGVYYFTTCDNRRICSLSLEGARLDAQELIYKSIDMKEDVLRVL